MQLYEELERSLKSWLKLPEDWDGEGAARPNEKSVLDAISFIGALKGFPSLDVEPLMNANGNAGICINTGGLYLEIEFYRDGRFVYFLRRGERESKGEAKMARATWFCNNVLYNDE
jgi:hypothetical protein